MRASTGALPCGFPVPETWIGMGRGTSVRGPQRVVCNGNLRSVGGTENLGVGCGLCCPLFLVTPYLVRGPKAGFATGCVIRTASRVPESGITRRGIILSGIISFFNIELVSCFPQRSPRIVRDPDRNSL